MIVKMDFPWRRYGIIVELTSRAKGICPQFGKTMLQKMIYLLQNLYHIDCGYSFSLYTYGPFSPQILQDLDLVETLKGVVVISVSSRTGGYLILPGEKQDIFLKKAEDFLNESSVKSALDQLIVDFASCSAKDLELKSTIVYVYNEIKESGRVTRKKILKLVHEIKPHFSETDIGTAEKQLENKGNLEISN
jgi:uncharacterized protein YwgA